MDEAIDVTTINLTDSSGFNLLGRAITEGGLATVQHILKLDACDVNSSDPKPLALAIEQLYFSKPHLYLPLSQYESLDGNAAEGEQRVPRRALSLQSLRSHESVEDVMEMATASPNRKSVSLEKLVGESTRLDIALAVASHPGVDANVQFPTTNIPVLAFAVQSGMTNLVSALVKAGADATSKIPNCFGHTPLSLAVTAPIPEVGIVKLLLDTGLDVRQTFLKGTTLLRAAAFHRKSAVELVGVLLSSAAGKGLDPTACCENGTTALHSAAAAHHPDDVATALAEVLLSPRKRLAGEGGGIGEEPDPPLCDPRAAAADTGCLPLHLAAMTGKQNLCNALLVAAPDTVDSVDARGYTPAMLAASRGHAVVLRVLIAAKASLTKTGHPSGMLPVHLAAHRGRVSCLQLLATVETVDLNMPLRGIEGLTPLFLAAVGGHEQAMGMLGAEKVPYEAPLLLACRLGVAQIVWHLLMLRHEVEGQNSRKVELARARGWRSTVVSQETYFELFSNYRKAEKGPRAPSDKVGGSQRLGRSIGARSTPEEEAESSLEAAPVVATTPLGITVENGFVDVSATLIAFGEDVNEPVCPDGPPPVLFAVQQSQWQCAQLFICAQANRFQVKKAFEVARSKADAPSLNRLAIAIRSASEKAPKRESDEDTTLFGGDLSFNSILSLFQH